MNTEYTESEINDIAEAARLIAKGRTEEVQEMHPTLTRGEWKPLVGGLYIAEGWRCRPNPKPVSRPWSKPEDVPGPVCWLRWTDEQNEISMIVGIAMEGVSSIMGRDIHFETWDDLSWQEYSTDRINWHPCTVTDED